MTWTYTPGSGSNRDRIRFSIGDVSSEAPADEQLQNEEIDDALVTAGGWRAAAAACAYARAFKLATKATAKRMGQASLEWKRVEYLMALAKQLTSSVSLTAIPFAGGISVSQRNTLDQDTDRITPAFQKGMLDNPPSMWTGSTNSTAVA